MIDRPPFQLISYIAPGAPATRRPAEGELPFLRPEIGFAPAWYRQHVDVDFGRGYHTDPAYRRDAMARMRDVLQDRFPGTSIGGIDRPGADLDVLTGVYGTTFVAGIYGVPAVYVENNWPDCEPQSLTAEQVDDLAAPDLESNPAFQELLSQVDWIAEHIGRIEGFLNWQGVLNNAHRLRGQELFVDMMDDPGRCLHLFECVCTTMIDAAAALHDRQRASGVAVDFFTVSNCLVNMISPDQYYDLLLPFDRRIAEAFGCIGVHNCAWRADPYVDAYAEIPFLAYVDMGIDSDLSRARETFPHARRAIMYTPMDMANRTLEQIRADFEKIARDYAPCDVVIGDIEAGMPDERIRDVICLCEDLSVEHA